MLKTARAFSVFISVAAAISFPLAGMSEPLKGGVSETGTIQAPPSDYGSYGYPAPQMVQPAQPLQGQVDQQQRPPQRKLKLQGQARDQGPPPQQRPPIQLQAQQTAVLPPQFLGNWLVLGQRTKVVGSTAQYEMGAAKSFATQTRDIWQIQGNPQMGYQMGNNTTGVGTQLVVEKADGQTAFMRYEHGVDNTVVREAIVMQLMNGGTQFTGLIRMSVIKPGIPQPRATVTYQLQGQRQR